MRFFSVLAIAIVVTVMWVAPSFAIEAAFDGQYRIRAIYLNDVKDFDKSQGGDNDSWIDQRFRLGINIKEAPVSGYVQMQMGGNGSNFSTVWGQGPDETSPSWSYGSGEESFILRQAYLSFPGGPVTFKIGRSYASHGFLAGGMFENIADRYILSMKLNEELNVSLIHAKGREGSYVANSGIDQTATSVNDNDRNIYNLGVNYKLGDQGDAAARVYYVRDGKNGYGATGASAAGTLDAWWLTAQTNLKINPVNVYLSGAYLTGKANNGTELDIKGYALHGDVNTNRGPAKVGVVAGLGSGDKDTTDNKLNTFFPPGLASYIQTHIFYQAGENNYSNAFLNTTNLNLQNGSLQTLSNVTWAGLYGDYKAAEDLTLSAKVATFKKTEALSGTSEDIGNEVDLTANYKIQKGLSLLTFAAWFSPDKGITGGGTAKEDTVSEYYARLQWEF